VLKDHPDFVVTIGGSDVTREVLSWTLNDCEEGMSSIEVRVDNKDMKHSGAFKIDDVICLRFGTAQEMAPKVEMKTKKFTEHYGKDGLYINFTALDCTECLSGKSGGGQHNKSKPSEIQKELAEKAGLQVEQKETKEEKCKGPGGTECNEGPGFPSARDAQQEIARQASKQADWSSAMAAERGDDSKSDDINQKALSVYGSELGKKDAENKAKNTQNKAKSNTITAQMRLIGVPVLKAKKMLTVTGLGEEASGEWYVKTVSHNWNPRSGYNTSVTMLRKDTKQGGGDPVIYYAEIYKKDTLFMGPRQYGKENQGSFTFGDGQHIQSFSWTYNDQATKAAGKGVKGKAVNIRKPKKYLIDVNSKGSGQGGK